MTLRITIATFAAFFGLAFGRLSLGGTDGAHSQQSTRGTKEPDTGSLEGVVTFHGTIPKSSIPDDAGVQRDLLQVDTTTRGLANVVVWLSADSHLTNPTSKAAIAAAHMDQRDHEFVPRVIAVLAGQPVRFSNSDPANHNVRAASVSQPTNEFNVFTGIDGSYTHRFAAVPQHSPIRLGCDIHPWMRGWIYVLEHPYFAVTDERGRFQIRSVPVGKYALALRQPDIKYLREQPVTVSIQQPTKVQIEIQLDGASKLP